MYYLFVNKFRNLCAIFKIIYNACMHAQLLQSCLTLWDSVRQALLSMGFSRQEYWSGLPCPHLRDLPNPGIELTSPEFPKLQEDSLLLSHEGRPLFIINVYYLHNQLKQ